MVSVVVPVYNAQRWLEKCVFSIINQTYKDLEILLIDDGSTDKSGKICDRLAEADDRIKVIHQENSGASVARNNGILAARGKFIAFVDSDDRIESDYLEHLLDSKYELTVCGTKRECCNRFNENSYKKCSYSTADEIDYFYICDKLFSPYCKLFKRSILLDNNIRFPEEYFWGEDGVFVVDYIKYVSSIQIIEYTGYIYNSNERPSLSTTIKPNVLNNICKTRKYCIDVLCSLAKQEQRARITDKLLNDIVSNCIFFINKLFISKKYSFKEKKYILNEFKKCDYYEMAISNPIYFNRIIFDLLNDKSCDNPFIVYEKTIKKSRLKQKKKKIKKRIKSLLRI